MDIVRAMQVFVSVVDAGSLTAAAHHCDMSATMVGNYVQALESRLGTRLLNRTTRRQHVTAFGQVYYERCVEILGLITDADALAQQTHAVPRGRLRITAPVSFGVDGLMPALADYTAAYPCVDLDLNLGDTVTDLVAGGFEAAIRIGPVHDETLIARALAPYRMILCAAPAYLASRGMPNGPDDLQQHACMTFSFAHGTEWWSPRREWRLLGPEGDVTVPITGPLQVDNSQALRRTALAGMGITMLPEMVARDDLATHRLVRVLPQHEFPPRPMHVVYLRDRRMTPKLQSFIAFVTARFGAATDAAAHRL
ncbi:LysR family transcriptional regulator [Bradyrhizobium sp. U87765 SZCCT0131]|uniref:LysR family transcriptional regulator n=1 Tax=unclassified Bradyrhizobium TaxID=2631580 RepID=UPI001BA7F286|nr:MULTISPECIES: LysR family transcriptional regulator [unclassified Bradyrhizobium]MBR1219539.1 LysR family transcriptional regulator [Bradyrhizobium sp. U87765 SZCCT0131]MBR1262190.1 LysR family transcriptional regulator [Bradyrhizobium sp. U87765 SZCCT0134]MBR1308627.1 LysR family transcriptional regulator [Bradyrhizobium sp. U87765 SZCCT0110]MBR1317972.1 LysR family transcriptional regulator [Bradyrhizobium sp. U87765 SZCCT0109]MBR1351675.1 LysR family transcriptional regulator [Bradyrhizo